MALPDEIFAAVKRLEAVFLLPRGRAGLDPAGMAEYRESLQFIAASALERAVDYLITRGDNFPTPAQIHKAVTMTAAGAGAAENEPFPAPDRGRVRGVRVETEREEIAAAYRMRMAEGRPFPPGLASDHPDVVAAVEERRDRHRVQDEERANHPGRPANARQEDKEAYVALCMRQMRQNLAGVFVTRSGKRVDPLRAVQEAFGLKAREEPATPEGEDDVAE